MTQIEKYRAIERELDFQLRYAEFAETSNIIITKEQGYTLLALVQILIEKIEKVDEQNA